MCVKRHCCCFFVFFNNGGRCHGKPLPRTEIPVIKSGATKPRNEHDAEQQHLCAQRCYATSDKQPQNIIKDGRCLWIPPFFSLFFKSSLLSRLPLPKRSQSPHSASLSQHTFRLISKPLSLPCAFSHLKASPISFGLHKHTTYPPGTTPLQTPGQKKRLLYCTRDYPCLFSHLLCATKRIYHLCLS